MASRAIGQLRGSAILACLGFALLASCTPAQAAITRSGTLHATVTDDFRSQKTTTRYTLQSGKHQTVVQPTELAAEPGDRVVVTGEVRGNKLVGTVEATGPSAQAVAPGPHKVAVVLITFPGSEAPWPPRESRSEVFTGANSANAFYQEESYGEISLTGKLSSDGDVFGWLTIDSPTAGCPYKTWKDDADAAAADAGIDLSGYQHIIYSFPFQGSCSWLGIAGGDWVMLNGNVFGTRAQVTIHELGHNLGLLHAGSWTCASGGVKVQESDSCTVTEYGDPFDVMGNLGRRHNSGWNLARLGFIDPGNVKTVDATGIYSMHSALHPTAQPTTLRVPRTREPDDSVSTWYYLEVREQGGTFENFSDASMTGVSIRVAPSPPGISPETLLLDANPATSTFQDAPLEVGQSFDGRSARIETVSAGGGAATVSVELDEAPPSVPTGVTAAGGVERATLQWDASTDEFGVERYVVYRDDDEIGTTPGTNFLDSPAPVGDHDYVVYAEDVAGNLSAASDPATATVEPDVEPPTTPTDLTATVGNEGVQLQWDASSDNVGVDHYRVFRDGSQINTSDTTDLFDPFAPGGAYAYVVYAVDKAGNQSDASAPAMVTVPAVSGPVCSAGSCQVTYRYSGSTATWTVPVGVSEADFTVEGARGGGFGFNGGARAGATLGSLAAEETVTVRVGGRGKPYADGGEGGFNDGGDGGVGGGGGGGFSSVALDSTLMLLAGGGGGEGARGFNAIAETLLSGGSGGQGGKLAAVGFAGGSAVGVHGATLGGGGGGAAAGNGGSGGGGGAVTGTSDCPGGASPGATGAAGSSLSGGGGLAAGGGGGGGYVGGGQGGGGAGDACGSTAGSGGGGGGSSFAAPGLAAEFTGGARLGDGQVLIAYPNPISAATRSYLTGLDQELGVNAAAGVRPAVSGPSGVPLSLSVARRPAHGSLALSDDGSFTYMPDSGYAGVDSFAYRVDDPSGNYATAQASLRVAAPPSASISAPAAGTYVVGQSVPTSFSCAEGTGGTGLLSCNDSNGAKTTMGGAGHLDTATVGAHAYTVTAVSKEGFSGSTSIPYTVVSTLEQPPLPPGPDVPNDPGEPRPRINLSLGIGTESLDGLLRTRKLVLVVRVSRAATVVLRGRARLEISTRRAGRARLVEVFDDKTIVFPEPGKRTVTLTLSRRGLEMLRRQAKSRLAIAGSATDDAGGRAKRTVTLSLR